MSVDADNNLRVGSFNSGRRFVRVNGEAGAIETPARSFSCGAYGGLIDEHGVIWSANGSQAGLLGWDPNAPTARRIRSVSPYGEVIAIVCD
jgi:hypothetical protein